MPFERLAEAGNALDELIESRYLQTTWGISDENVAKLAAYAHEGQSPRSIYRIELMESSMAQMLRLTYRFRSAAGAVRGNLLGWQWKCITW